LELKRFRAITLVVTFALLLTSCLNTVKKTSYLNKLSFDTTIVTQVKIPTPLVIQPKDILSINVSSLNPDLDEKFNALGKYGSNDLNGNVFLSGHEVDNNGNVRLHYIGEVMAKGLTRNLLAKKIEQELQPYLKDPIVKVNFLNKKITVMGEVGSPRIISMKDESMHILDALVASGDLKDDAVIDDIVILRDSSGVKQLKHINLEDQTLLNSDWSILLPNDIVFVKKDITTKSKEEKKRSLQSTFSLIVSLVTFLAIIFNNLVK
jgi:polysaccharide export outer membrane protein